MVRHRLAGSFGDSSQNGGELGNLLAGRHGHLRRHWEQIWESHRVEQRDLRATARRLTHAMSQNRHFAPQMCPDHQQ